jgi:hypothetical protein
MYDACVIIEKTYLSNISIIKVNYLTVVQPPSEGPHFVDNKCPSPPAQMLKLIYEYDFTWDLSSDFLIEDLLLQKYKLDPMCNIQYE